ncbi:MAG: erythromycin esterase family protein [Bacteroidales bacterium]|nr:erythromycin esterase family protein [Bacteroidales bacterium]
MNRTRKVILAVFSLLFCSCITELFREPVSKTEPSSPDLSGLNLDFEVRNPQNSTLPANWYTRSAGFVISLDNNEKHSGQLSLKMEMQNNPNRTSGVCETRLPVQPYIGKIVEYRGWIKTKGVQNGYAALWFLVYGENNTVIGYDNMFYRGLIGDNEWTQVSIRMRVSKDAKEIYFGGSFNGAGTVWFDNFEIVVCAEPKTSLSQEELAVLKQYVYPLRTYEPDGGDTKDLMILDNLIGSSKVVGLGENSHGSSEIFKIKNRIIQYIAANHGFDIFSIESNMPRAYKINDYIVRGEGDPKNLIRTMLMGAWQNDEVLDMVEWMRRFNDPVQRILFTAFDVRSYQGSIDVLSDAFKEDAEMENNIADLKKKLDDNAGVSEINPLLLLLENSIEAFSFPSFQKVWLLQNILIIRQYLTPSRGPWRDKFMADNVMWIKEQNPDSRLVLWAHNIHIMKTENMQGYHLAQKLGNDYTTFGFTFFEGSYIADGSKGSIAYVAEAAYPGTLEYFLNQLNEPIFILDLKKIKSDNRKDTQWLMEYLPYREADEMGDQKPTEFIYRRIVDDFDYLIFIKRSSPSGAFWLQ